MLYQIYRWLCFWLELRWLQLEWWWAFTVPAREAKIRFIQEMEWSNPTDAEWDNFVNSLTWNQFIGLMCLQEPAEADEDDDSEEEYEEDYSEECEEYEELE